MTSSRGKIQWLLLPRCNFISYSGKRSQDQSIMISSYLSYITVLFSINLSLVCYVWIKIIAVCCINLLTLIEDSICMLFILVYYNKKTIKIIWGAKLNVICPVVLICMWTTVGLCIFLLLHHCTPSIDSTWGSYLCVFVLNMGDGRCKR